MLSKPFKVVLVEDQEDVLDMIRDIIDQRFTEKQFTLTVFKDSSLALKHIMKEQIDIVITDLNMPETFGDSILRQCIEARKRTMFIFLTGDQRITPAMNAYMDGARFFLRKPFRIDHLVTALTNCLQELDYWYQVFSTKD